MGISISMATRISPNHKGIDIASPLKPTLDPNMPTHNAPPQATIPRPQRSTRLYAATGFRASSLRGAFLGAEEFAESDLGASFLGFLRSPLADAAADAGVLFSPCAAVGAGFDGGAEVCGLEASLGGAFFGSVSSFLGVLLLWGLGAEVCVEAEGLASGCFGGAEVRCDFRGWGLDSLGDGDSVLD